jgi:glycosyltransferase involved in cell wall biosynthesis
VRTLIVQPETAPSPSPFPDIFPSIAADLARRGHAVTLLTTARKVDHSVPGVNTVSYWSDGMMSSQSGIKSFFGQSLFSLQLFFHAVLRLKPYDVLLVRNSPPVWIGLTAMLVQFFRGTKFAYQVPELYPEAAAIRDDGQLGGQMNLAAKIERWICDTAKTVIVPTLDMVDTLRDRGVRNDSVALLSCNSQNVPDPETQLPESLHRDFDRFRVIYIGHMSAAENLEFVGDAAFLLRDRQDVEFIFVGDGPQKAELLELCGPTIEKNCLLP